MARPGKVQKHNLRAVAPIEIVQVEVSTVKVRSLLDARIRVTGSYSSREYVFPQAGSVLDVETEDVESLLKRRQSKGCCGGGGGGAIFELVED